MNKEIPVSLVLGCGEYGLKWADQQKNGTLGVDSKNISHSNPNFIKGEVFELPVKANSIDFIYADFIFNAVNVSGYTLSDIKENPNILMNEPFPKSVRDWRATKTEPQVRESTDELKWLLRTETLREIGRVLKINGEAFVIDRPFIIKWIKDNSNNIFKINPGEIKIENLEITPEDHDRSLSLRERLREGEPIEKILLRKLY